MRIITKKSFYQRLRTNLFATPIDALLSIVGIGLGVYGFYLIISWGVFNASFSGSTSEDCTGSGACWVFVRVWAYRFTYGFYPEGEVWRVNLGFSLAILTLLPIFVERIPFKGYFLMLAVMVLPTICFILFYGGAFGLEIVDTNEWGGLMITLILSGFGILGSFPLGILLALGRRSSLPIIKVFCVLFIEFWRGVPLITVLFMASVMFNLFVPEGLTIDKFARAAIGIVLFAAAYIAEVIRGGLQGVPKGQIEATSALGLNYVQTQVYVVLPQALMMVIPGIINVFVMLLKDTSLVLIIGLFDVLGMVKLVLTNPNWTRFAFEGYIFAAFVFWLLCFCVSSYGRRLEKKRRIGR
jgi:general L-amino acid transport system permease protein